MTGSEAEAVISFPATGGSGFWILTKDHLDELVRDYDTIDVLEQAKRAHAWILANPTRRKTPRGYPAFLVSWLSRAVDSRASARPSTTAPPTSRRGRPEDEAEIARIRRLAEEAREEERREATR